MKKLAAVMILTMCGALYVCAADWTIFLRHAGSLRIGMTVDQVRKALADPKAKLESPGDAPEQCGYLSSKQLPEGLGLMFVEGRLERIDVTKIGIFTASGAGVGDAEARIKDLYPGKILVQPHHYTGPDGHYLRFIPTDAADRNFELLFETDGNKVTEYRVGTKRAVEFVEGCL